MPLTPVTEYFNGGLVTARHPSLLNPGELQLATDCVYRDKDMSIQRAPGRTAYNSTTLKTTPTSGVVAGIKGLAQLTFDQNTDQLLAWPAGDGTNSYMWKSDFTAITGTFTVLTGPGLVSATNLSGTTITAASGTFANMVIGARVYGAAVAPGSIVTATNLSTTVTVDQTVVLTGAQTVYFDSGIAQTFPDAGTETLDIIQWQNSYFALTRNGNPFRLYWKEPSGTVTTAVPQFIGRPAGLLPVTQAPTVSTQSGVGWSAVLGNGYYWFLVTEILTSEDPKIPDVESGYTGNEGKAVATQITTVASQFIRITFPTVRNDGTNGTNRASHWGIYMAVKSINSAAFDDNTTMPSAATFRRIAKVDIAETSKDIKYSNVTLPATGYSLPTTTAAFGSLTQFSNPSGFLNRSGLAWASAFSGGALTAGEELGTFTGFSVASGSPYTGYAVTGIKVNVVARANPLYGSAAGYYISLNNGATKFSYSVNGVADKSSMYGKSYGDQFDNWGVAWTPTDIATLKVRIQKSYSASIQQLEVDYVEVTVYFSGATVDTGSLSLDGPPYQVVTYRSQIGTVINDPANYVIPSASTGDIFQGSMVLNDLTVPSLIRYSIPNAPESFPKPYFIKFDSRKKDIVTLIRRLGQILVVGMRDSIKRVNYLPTEVDVDFQRGVAHEDIVVDHGIVGPRAATTIDLSGNGVVLAYVGYNGIYFTDGITARPLNADIKIQDLCKSTALSTCVLRVYPREKWLVFYYCPAGASHTKNTRAIVFNYGPEHIKEGGFLAATGPLSISTRSAAEASLGGVTYLLTGHQTDGTVYVEDSGDTQPTSYQVHNSSDTLVSAPIVPKIRTRRMYLGGYERDTRIQRIYLLHDSLGSNSVTASSTTTSGSTTVTSSAAFGSVVVGMIVTGTGIPVETVVTNVATSSSITISNPATVSGTATLTFDDGGVSVTMRGAGIDTTVATFNTTYGSTTTGDLFVVHNDNYAQGVEFDIEKILITGSTYADLSRAMKLHTLNIVAEDQGTEMNRRT